MHHYLLTIVEWVGEVHLFALYHLHWSYVGYEDSSFDSLLINEAKISKREKRLREIQIPDRTDRPSRDTGVITSFGFPIRIVPIPGLDKATYERRLNDGTQ